MLKIYLNLKFRIISVGYLIPTFCTTTSITEVRLKLLKFEKKSCFGIISITEQTSTRLNLITYRSVAVHVVVGLRRVHFRQQKSSLKNWKILVKYYVGTFN